MRTHLFRRKGEHITEQIEDKRTLSDINAPAVITYSRSLQYFEQQADMAFMLISRSSFSDVEKIERLYELTKVVDQATSLIAAHYRDKLLS
jgi:hypothetical protein